MKKKNEEKAASDSRPSEPNADSKEVNNTDDAYKGAPRNRDLTWRNNNG